jgi:uncharacterized SAM-binding protein YcdF (DUF218 family)
LFVGQLLMLRISSVPLVVRACLLTGFVLLWVSSAPVTANALVRILEAPDSPVDSVCTSIHAAGSRAAPVVVLGGALDAYTDSDNPYEVLSRESLRRTLHATQLAHDENRFYLLGGGQTSRKLSNFMARVLVVRGMAPERIVSETRSLSTRENARALSTLLDPAIAGPVILVSSRLHMNRAMATFRAEGFRICPADVGSLYSRSAGWVGFLPYIQPLVKTTAAWRELLASLLFSWRTDSMA